MAASVDVKGSSSTGGCTQSASYAIDRARLIFVKSEMALARVPKMGFSVVE